MFLKTHQIEINSKKLTPKIMIGNIFYHHEYNPILKSEEEVDNSLDIMGP